jgi:hypothetical protein
MSTVGYAVAIALIIAAGSSVDTVFGWTLMGAATGAFVGELQRQVLHRRFSQAGKWAWVSTIAWAVGWAVAYVFASEVPSPGTDSTIAFIVTMIVKLLFLICPGPIIALITGVALVRLLLGSHHSR